MRLIHPLSPIAFAALLLAGGCSNVSSTSSPAAEAASSPAPDAATPNTIVIDNFTFRPAALTVAPGTTVTWINRDDVPHTVTSSGTPRTLDSPTLDTDQRFSYTFTTPGSFDYFCTVHPHMTAKITVQ